METDTRTTRPVRRDPISALLLASTVLTGLVAGVYYCFVCAVMPALSGAGDVVFIDVMQRVNDRIENPVFFLGFFGAFLLPLAAAVLLRRRGGGAVLRWTVVALALYTLGALTTIAFNLPLNDDLKAAGDPAGIADPTAVRDDFEDPWIAWNIVRTLLSTAAIGAMAYAFRLCGRETVGRS